MAHIALTSGLMPKWLGRVLIAVDALRTVLTSASRALLMTATHDAATERIPGFWSVTSQFLGRATAFNPRRGTSRAMNYQTNSVPDSLLRHEMVQQVVGPFNRSIARIQSRQDLWANLSTLQRFQRLTEADQQMIAAIAISESESGPRLKLGTVGQ